MTELNRKLYDISGQLDNILDEYEQELEESGLYSAINKISGQLYSWSENNDSIEEDINSDLPYWKAKIKKEFGVSDGYVANKTSQQLYNMYNRKKAAQIAELKNEKYQKEIEEAEKELASAPVRKCDECGKPLDTIGSCPYCDEGEEDLSEALILKESFGSDSRSFEFTDVPVTIMSQKYAADDWDEREDTVNVEISFPMAELLEFVFEEVAEEDVDMTEAEATENIDAIVDANFDKFKEYFDDRIKTAAQRYADENMDYEDTYETLPYDEAMNTAADKDDDFFTDIKVDDIDNDDEFFQEGENVKLTESTEKCQHCGTILVKTSTGMECPKCKKDNTNTNAGNVEDGIKMFNNMNKGTDTEVSDSPIVEDINFEVDDALV